jgi:hypothetical protein
MKWSLRLFANVITHPLFVWCYLDLLLALESHSPITFFSLVGANIGLPAFLFFLYLKRKYGSRFSFNSLVQMEWEDRLFLLIFALLGLAGSSFLLTSYEKHLAFHSFFSGWLLSLFILLLFSLFFMPSLHLYSWALLCNYYVEHQWISWFSIPFYLWLFMIGTIWFLRWLEGHHSFLDLLLGFLIGIAYPFYKEWIVKSLLD